MMDPFMSPERTVNAIRKEGNTPGRTRYGEEGKFESVLSDMYNGLHQELGNLSDLSLSPQHNSGNMSLWSPEPPIQLANYAVMQPFPDPSPYKMGSPTNPFACHHVKQRTKNISSKRALEWNMEEETSKKENSSAHRRRSSAISRMHSEDDVDDEDFIPYKREKSTPVSQETSTTSSSSSPIVVEMPSISAIEKYVAPLPPTQPIECDDFSNSPSTPTDSENGCGSKPKRGQYKCGRCGFFPKKQKHDCELIKAQQDQEKANSQPSFYPSGSTTMRAQTTGNTSLPSQFQHMLFTASVQQAFQPLS